MKKYIFIFGFLLLPFSIFSATFPLEITYPRFGPIGLPSFLDPVEFLPRYIDYVYRVSGIAIVVLGFFSLVLGAVFYITSVGNVGKQIEARERILGAFLGILIFASSFILLRFFHRNLTQIQLAQLRMNFVEVEEGVWLCNDEIRVRDPYLSQSQNGNFFLTFENYIFLRDLIKEDWLEGRLDPNIQKVITNLVDTVKRECIRFNTSAEIPPGFRYPKWLYIVGNYGAILHSFPNFKGFCGVPFLLNGKIDLRSVYASANLAYEELVLAGRLQSTDPDLELPSPAFEIPFADSIPKFSITVFSDFRLNYADDLLNISENKYYPTPDATTTLTFYTFRNFHEDLDPSFQQATSVCPRLSATSTTSATPTQPCFREVEITLRSYLPDPSNPITTINLSLQLPNQTRTIQARGVIVGERIDLIDLDSCYSFKVEPPEEEEIREGWVVIVYSTSSEPATPTEVLLRPYFWCDVFNNSDRNLEDNYVSYFCEDKARAKRYPCVNLVWIAPGVVLKPE